jgi:hypothetical protein
MALEQLDQRLCLSVSAGDFDHNGGSDILWHNASTNEMEIWISEMDRPRGALRVVGRAPVLGEFGNPESVGLPWSIVGTGDFDRNGGADVLWHNESTNETQMWLMDRHRVAGRATVVGEDGNPAFVGLPWSIVGAGDFDRNGGADILWHNESTNETQMWLMDGHRITGRATVVGEDGQPAFVGLPWSIVGAGDFDRNGGADILWHNESTNETQIWLMDRHRVIGRATVVHEDRPLFLGLPWSIAGAGDFDLDGNTDILWRNETTHATQFWRMDRHRVTYVVNTRLDSGALDWSFGNLGRTVVAFDRAGGTEDVAYSMAIQRDGKIVVAGSSEFGTNEDYGFAVTRLNPDGSLDSSFGRGTGKMATGFDVSGYLADHARAVAIDDQNQFWSRAMWKLAGPAITSIALEPLACCRTEPLTPVLESTDVRSPY